MNYLYLSCWPAGGVPENSQTLQVVTIALGYYPKLNCKTLLLKTPHTWLIGSREIKLVPIASFISTS